MQQGQDGNFIMITVLNISDAARRVNGELEICSLQNRHEISDLPYSGQWKPMLADRKLEVGTKNNSHCDKKLI